MKHTEKLDIPPVLQQKLEEFRSRLWSVKIGEGALAGIAGLVLSFLFVFILDRFFDTPTWLRWLILLLGFAVPAVGIPIRYHKWVWRKRSLGQIARVLRKRYPRLGDELLGIVDLAHERESKGHSQALITAAMNQVAEKARNQDFSDAVPENHYRGWTFSSLILAGVAALAILVVSGAAQNSMARWLTPWRLIERYTFAKLEPVQEEMVVPFAEPFDLSTRLRENTEWKPTEASVRLPGKTRLKSDLDPGKDAYDFSVPPQKDDAALALRVGDALEKIRIKPLPRPELESLAAKVRLPDYLMYQRDPVIPVRGGTVDLVEGATAGFIGTASRELAKATVNGAPAALSGKSFSTRPEPVEGAETRVFEWEDKHGLTAKSPFELRVNAIPDSAPDVFAKKLSGEEVILPDEVVTFEINSSDDFGLREIGLEWIGVRDPIYNPEPAVGGKMVASGGAEKREIEARGTFSAERSFIKPQTLQVRAYAEDYFPNRKRVYSPVFVLHIMNPSDHANWLTNEFGKWFSRAREVYEKEQQLHQSNRELRSLSSEDLDRPENRRKLERQAASEASNARRLEALTSSGRDLVRQATKNDEFDAEKLESWAEMMRSLDDISKNRMPSVADLLKKASQAEGGSSDPSKTKPGEESPPEGKSNPPAPSVKNQNGEEDPASAPPKTPGDGESPDQLPKAPSISDKESSFDKEKPKEPGSEEKEQPSGPGRLGLPSTTLKGEAPEPGNGQKSATPESPAGEKLEQALEEQRKLLQEFARVTDELQEILSSLEASTFVKRLKAASRKQLDIAKNMNGTVSGGFGISRERIAAQLQEVVLETSKAEEEESDKLYTIQTDLDAYFQRKQDKIYKNVLEQMRKSAVVTQLKKLGETASDNYNGRSISAAEYWSDTLDRWAEELVAASQGQQQEGGQDQDKMSLPPEIVLEVMKIARGEMDLREETREMDNIRSSLSPDDYANKVKPLEMVQTVLRTRVDDVVLDLLDIPGAGENFDNELKLLNYVSDVMRQARGELSRPNTGPEVIGAQTEAIELLLQARRQPPNQGGGGGGGSPGGGSSGKSGGALSDIDVAPGMPVEPGSGPKRAVGQSTGKTGQEFPEEFRNGLDTYFNELEKIR